MLEYGDSFPKQYRLLSRSDYLRLSDSKTLVSGQSFLIVWKINDGISPRLGITTSRKVGKAVVRNRLKRIIREFYRHHISQLPCVDLHIIVRRQAVGKSFTVLSTELQRAFHQIGLRTCCHESL